MHVRLGALMCLYFRLNCNFIKKRNYYKFVPVPFLNTYQECAPLLLLLNAEILLLRMSLLYTNISFNTIYKKKLSLSVLLG